MISRRKFVATMAVGAGALSVGSLEILEKSGLMNKPLSGLDADAFRRVRPKAFQVIDNGGMKTSLSLVGVHERRLPSQDSSIRVDSFSLMFAAREGVELTSGMHRIDHPELGASELFLSPVGLPGKDQKFQAIFTRVT